MCNAVRRQPACGEARSAVDTQAQPPLCGPSPASPLLSMWTGPARSQEEKWQTYMYSTGYISKERRENLEISVWALQHKSVLKVLEEGVGGRGRGCPKAKDNNWEQTLCWWFKTQKDLIAGQLPQFLIFFLSLPQPASLQWYPACAALPPGLPMDD